jgi:hypothetical protein
MFYVIDIFLKEKVALNNSKLQKANCKQNLNQKLKNRLLVTRFEVLYLFVFCLLLFDYFNMHECALFPTSVEFQKPCL